MKNFKKIFLVFAGIVLFVARANSQTEAEIEKQLDILVDVENPVKMPVIGIGAGYLGYYGNVNDQYRSYSSGELALHVNVSMYLTNITEKQFVRGNFFFLTGNLSGNQRTVSDTSLYKNLNFKSNVTSFGFSGLYSFRPWIKGKTFAPFVSLGLELLNFNSKADYGYHYWTDGTIRNLPQKDENLYTAEIISRNYSYDTDLRKIDRSKLGNYSQMVLAIPVDIGIDFNISPRVTLRAATSFHYAFTNNIDDLSSKSKNDAYKGSYKHNMYTFTYLSLHLDFFSDAEKIQQALLFLEVSDEDFDMSQYDDEDWDGVPDILDLCPDTPDGVEVDSVGCPLDSDGDGIPDYLDLEPNSRPGAIVDENGVEISEDVLIEKLNMSAIRRSEVEAFLIMQKLANAGKRGELVPIPAKFKKVDTSNDGYISFDELLQAINDFWDGKSSYTPKELEELQAFFFSQ